MSEDYDYTAAVTAPLTEEQAAELRQALTDGTVPRRKARILADDCEAEPNPRIQAAAEQMRQERAGGPAQR